MIAFGQGKLAADESSQVEQHLEVCRECCETLLDLKDDTFVGLVRVAKPSDSGADRRMGTLARPEPQSSNAGTGKSAHPTDGGVADRSEQAATLLVQSGEAVSADELPVELREHSRCRIVELIGKGGMGNVYRAEHRLMNREVAIKLINSQLMQHPHAVERFRREVQAAAKLSHPNIVAAYDAEQAGNAHFLVMEFVEGTDLATVVKHRGPMSVAEACRCIRQAAAGLQHAHEKGMVHRDIKPHNLMLSAEGQVRILDFGSAGFATESALEGSRVRQNAGDANDAPQSGDSGYDASAAHLLSAGFDDTLRLWHVADRKLVRTIDIGTKVEKMIPLLDGRRVMLSGAHTRGWGPMTYDLEKGEKIDATPNAYSCMAVSADGRMLLVGS